MSKVRKYCVWSGKPIVYQELQAYRAYGEACSTYL